MEISNDVMREAIVIQFTRQLESELAKLDKITDLEEIAIAYDNCAAIVREFKKDIEALENGKWLN